MKVLAPNDMGHFAQNMGIDALRQNTGMGVTEARSRLNPQAPQEKDGKLQGIRRAKAREFGKPMYKVGF